MAAVPVPRSSRLAPLPQRDASILVPSGGENVTFCVPPLGTAATATATATTATNNILNGIRAQDAVPISVPVTLLSVSVQEYNEAVASEGGNPTQVWVTKIRNYSPLKTGWAHYRGMIHGADRSSLGLQAIFGDRNNPITDILALTDACSCAAVACSYVAYVVFAFYIAVNERWLQYTPQASHEAYTEAYPEHAFLVFFSYDFKMGRKGELTAFTSETDVVALAQKHTYTDLVYMVLETLRKHHKECIGDMDAFAWCENNLKKNYQLFLLSRKFWELQLQNAGPVISDLMRGLFPKHAGNFVVREVSSWYPQQAWRSEKVRLEKRFAKSQVHIPSVYQQVWFSPLYPVASIPPLPKESKHSEHLAPELHNMVWYLLWMLPLSDRNSFLTRVNAYIDRARPHCPPALQAQLEHFRREKSLDHATTRGMANLNFIRLRYCFTERSDKLYYFPPWHLLHPDHVIQENSVEHLSVVKVTALLTQGTSVALAGPGDPSTQRVLLRSSPTPLTTKLASGLYCEPIQGAPELVLSDYVIGVLSMLSLGSAPKPNAFQVFMLYEAMCCVAIKEEDVLVSLARYIGLQPADAQSGAQLCRLLREGHELVSDTRSQQTERALRLHPDDVQQYISKRANEWNAVSPLSRMSEPELAKDVCSVRAVQALCNSLGMRAMARATECSISTAVSASDVRVTVTVTPLPATELVIARDAETIPAAVCGAIATYVRREREPTWTGDTEKAALSSIRLQYKDTSMEPMQAMRWVRSRFNAYLIWPIYYAIMKRCPALSITLPGSVSWELGEVIHPPEEALEKTLMKLDDTIGRLLRKKDVRQRIIEATSTQGLSVAQREKIRYLGLCLPPTTENAALKQKLEQLAHETQQDKMAQWKMTHGATRARMILAAAMDHIRTLTPEIVQQVFTILAEDAELCSKSQDIIGVIHMLIEGLVKEKAIRGVCVDSSLKLYATHPVYIALLKYRPRVDGIVSAATPLPIPSSVLGKRDNSSVSLQGEASGIFVSRRRQ